MLALGGGQALAQSSAIDELRRCRGIAEGQARVACYDAIPLPGVAGTATVQATSSAASAAGTRATPGVAVSSASPASAVPAAAPAVAPAPLLRDFGLPERPVAALPQSIDSAIEGEFDGWTAGTRLRLANGQVWEIVDGSVASYRLRDPKVRVSRGLLGSFFLSIEGVAQSPRVRRVQ
jgi:hypothetical protein